MYVADFLPFLSRIDRLAVELLRSPPLRESMPNFVTRRRSALSSHPLPWLWLCVVEKPVRYSSMSRVNGRSSQMKGLRRPSQPRSYNITKYVCVLVFPGRLQDIA